MKTSAKIVKTKDKRTDGAAIKRLLKYARPYVPVILVALLCSVIQIAATLLAPVIIGRTVDYIIGENNVDFGVIFKNAGILDGLIAAAILFQYLSSMCINFASFRTIRDLRTYAFDKLSDVPLGYIDSRSHGDLMSRVGSDIDQISDGLIQGFSQLFSGVVTIVGTLAFMLVMNWKIALVVIFVTPLSMFIAKYISSHTYAFFKKQSETRGEQTAFAEEAIAGLKTVQAFSHERENMEKFDEINTRLEKSSLNASFYSSLANPATRFVNNIVYALVTLIGAFHILSDGAFTVGMLTIFLSYANQYTKPFNEISGVVTELQNAVACAARIFELLDEKEQPSDEGKRELPKAEGNVELKDVYFSYRPEQKLIEDFSLSVKPGQRVAIVGPTGCGKTTLINLLMRFYDVTGGSVKVEGEDVRDITRKSLRSNYGMVLQETWLKSGTVRDNLKMGKPEATDEEMIEACRLAQADEFIRSFPDGYDTHIEQGGSNVSGGQKQRLCIARALLKKPKILILDDSTSAVDTKTDALIRRAFAQEIPDTTKIIIAQRISSVEHADKIVVMDGGRIESVGTHEELLKSSPIYREVYESQNRGGDEQ